MALLSISDAIPMDENCLVLNVWTPAVNDGRKRPVMFWCHGGAFGGDPNNVTIFGESGGGAKICVLMAMPAARGLFHKAIIQSGPAVEMMRPADATATATQVLAELGLATNQVSELRRIPAKRL